VGVPVWEQHPKIDDDVSALSYGSVGASTDIYLEDAGGDVLRRLIISKPFI
jgi:hypothetical protein